MRAAEELPSVGDFEAFYDEARRCLLPRLRLAAPSGPDDVFHEALLVVFSRWPEVSAMANPMGWTWTVARRLAYRARSRDRRRPIVEAASAGREPEPPAATEGGADLLRALSSLRAEHALAFWSTQIADLDVAHTADLLGVPASTVKVWVHRARQQLAERSAGLAGRWISELRYSPAQLERSLIDRGHGRYVATAVPLIVDRPARWELHVGQGRYWLGTDDGERVDFGEVHLAGQRLTLRSIAAFDFQGGVRTAIPLGSNVGDSYHRLGTDADRMHLALLETRISPTDGVPDEVFRQVFFDSLVYRWVGPVGAPGPRGQPGAR